MSGESSDRVEITPETVAVVVFSDPDLIGDLGIGLSAAFRARPGVPPALLVAALRQLATTLEMEHGVEGHCPCGGDHG